MSRKRRAPRATAGDRGAWGDAVRIEFARQSKRFVHQASTAGQNPESPDPSWLLRHLQTMRESRGAGYTRRHARYVAYYLADHGQADLMMARPILVVLYAPDRMDGLAVDPEDPDASIGRAQAFADAAYSDTTLQGYMAVNKAYLAYCEDAGVDFLDTSGTFVAGWLALLGEKGLAYGTVRNARNALSSLFRKNRVVDHARSPEVRLVVDGIKQMNPPKVVRPFTANERIALVNSLESEGLGVRDRVITLMTAFGNWSVEKMALTQASDVSFTSDGVEISNGVGAPMVIGRHPDPDLDLEPWMRRLLLLSGDSGPLFQQTDVRRMRPSGVALSPQNINRALINTAKRAGLESSDVATRLRMLFEMECGDVSSSIVRRHYGVATSRRDDRTEEMRSANLSLSRKRRLEAYQ